MENLQAHIHFCSSAETNSALTFAGHQWQGTSRMPQLASRKPALGTTWGANRADASLTGLSQPLVFKQLLLVAQLVLTPIWGKG